MTKQHIEQTEPTTEDMQQENEKLYQQLTNKNEDYMVKLNRQLDKYGYEESQKIAIVNQMLPVIVEEQANHNLARSIYGSPTEAVAKMNQQSEQPREVEPSPTWQRYLDGSLLIAGVFMIISAISQYIGTQTQVGLISLLVLLSLGGAVVILISQYAPDENNKGFLKYILVSTVTLSVLMFFYATLEMIIPRHINILFGPQLASAIGAGLLTLKWFIKSKLNIRGNII